MDPKKLDTQRAFNLLMKKSGMTRKRPKKTRDFENRFGSKKTLSDHLSPRWNQWAERIVYVSFVCAIILGMVAAYEIFTRKPSTKNPNKHNTANPPSVISNEQTRQIIETNLRRFLEAENIEEKARYVSMEEEEIDHLRTYYTLRGRWERPLWKVERIYPMKSSQEKIWFVTYLDLERRRHTVSFERFGNDFLIHWSAMTGFCDIPWPDFIVQRPLGPVTMRCFIRQYEGIWPVNISQDKYQCFIIEDRQKLFYEIAIMKSDAYGCDILSKLPNTRRHPVTVELGYRRAGTSEHGKQLTIISLKHLRWQKLGVDPRNPSQPPSD